MPLLEISPYVQKLHGHVIYLRNYVLRNLKLDQVFLREI